MLKQKTEEEDLESEEELAEAEEEQEVRNPKPKMKFNTKRAEPQPKYVPVHRAALDGIVDTEKNTVSTDIMDILADIKNDLEEIKRSVVG